MQVSEFLIADIRVDFPRKYRDPDQVAAFNADIAQNGQRVPCVLARLEDGLHLADGHQRVAALQAAGKEVCLGWVDPRLTSLADILGLVVGSENRSDRSPLCVAEALQKLLDDTGMTQDEIAGKCRISSGHASKLLKLLKLPPAIRSRIGDGTLTAQHAFEVATEPMDRQVELLTLAVEKKLSTRALRLLVKPPRTQPAPKLLRLKFGDVVLVVPASLTVAKLKADLAEATESTAARFREVPKSALLARDVFKS